MEPTEENPYPFTDESQRRGGSFSNVYLKWQDEQVEALLEQGHTHKTLESMREQISESNSRLIDLRNQITEEVTRNSYLSAVCSKAAVTYLQRKNGEL